MCKWVLLTYLFTYCYCAPIAGAEYWDVSLHISETALPNFTKFSVYITRGRGSILLWRRNSICYVFPVLWMWMTSCLPGKGDASLGPGSESNIYDCLVLKTVHLTASQSPWQINLRYYYYYFLLLQMYMTIMGISLTLQDHLACYNRHVKCTVQTHTVQTVQLKIVTSTGDCC